MHSSPGATADLKVATTNFTAAPGAEGNVSSGGGLDSRRGPEFRSGLATSCGRASREPSANLRRDLLRDEEAGDARSITEVIWTDQGSLAFRRLGRALPAVSSRTRARLLAGFLGINLVAALLGQAQRLGWLGTSPWIRQLDSSPEGTLANSYSVVVWSAVAVLALAQLCRSTPLGSRRRFQVLGWLSLALIAALAAFEEVADLKDAIGPHTVPAGLAAALHLEGFPPSARWLPIVAPLLAAPLAAGG